jgi:hypothetical protein
MVVHRHRCTRCGYVWQCTESNRSQPGHDMCAICEALDRMRREPLGWRSGNDKNTRGAFHNRSSSGAAAR